MMKLLLLAIAPAVGSNSPARPCVPIASDNLAPTTSAIGDHMALRSALHEPMPEAPTMVMLHGIGGHLATTEYSVVLARGDDGVWRGTAVGRGKISIKDAPYKPLKRLEWVLGKDDGRKLDGAISRRCRFDRSVVSDDRLAPPSFGPMAERIDIVQRGHAAVTYGGSDGDGVILSIIRPPE